MSTFNHLEHLFCYSFIFLSISGCRTLPVYLPGVGGATAYLGGATAYLAGGATAYLGGATAYLVGGSYSDNRASLSSSETEA